MTGFQPASTSADPNIVQMTEERGEGQRGKGKVKSEAIGPKNASTYSKGEQ